MRTSCLSEIARAPRAATCEQLASHRRAAGHSRIPRPLLNLVVRIQRSTVDQAGNRLSPHVTGVFQVTRNMRSINGVRTQRYRKQARTRLNFLSTTHCL